MAERLRSFNESLIVESSLPKLVKLVDATTKAEVAHFSLSAGVNVEVQTDTLTQLNESDPIFTAVARKGRRKDRVNNHVE